MLLFELIVIAETWRKTWHLIRSSAHLGVGFRAPATTTVFREGTVYFVIIEVCATSVVISSFFGSAATNLVVLLPSVASPILTSRFYFHINAILDREESEYDFPTTFPQLGTQRRRTTSLVFAHENSNQ
ncbi:hypothetical protein C8Q79DRAFT_545316 [Trametes meyenii]|nr:hypothetical protein C8Q79DRAFT_545316 [Trametes meyenii]